MRILPPHSYKDSNKPGHLAHVKAYMLEAGCPTLRVVHIDGDLYQAIEGTHRLQAAFELLADDACDFDTTPDLDILDDSEPVDWSSLDAEASDFPGVETWGDFGASLYNKNADWGVKSYEF